MKLQSCKTCASTSFTPIPNGVKCDYCGNEYVDEIGSFDKNILTTQLGGIGMFVAKKQFFTRLNCVTVPADIKNKIEYVIREYYE